MLRIKYHILGCGLTSVERNKAIILFVLMSKILFYSLFHTSFRTISLNDFVRIVNLVPEPVFSGLSVTPSSFASFQIFCHGYRFAEKGRESGVGS